MSRRIGAEETIRRRVCRETAATAIARTSDAPLVVDEASRLVLGRKPRDANLRRDASATTHSHDSPSDESLRALAPGAARCEDARVPRALRLLALVFAAWLVLGFALATPAVRAADAPPPPLETCAAIRALSREQAARQLPLRVRGVVTLVPADAGGNFTVDDGMGVWVRVSDAPASAVVAALRPGDLVEVEGRTNEGHFAPIIAATAIRRAGRGALPVPRDVTQLDLESGRHDSQRVTIGGVVLSVENVARVGRTEVKLLVSTPTGGFAFILYAPQPVAAASLVDAEVSLTGVFLAFFNSRRQFLGARVLTNDPADLRVVRAPPADAFAAPEVSLRETAGFSAQGAELHRRRVRGTVTLSKAGKFFYVQEKPHALRINTRQPDALQPGDVVEAAGFFQLAHHRAEMHEAVFRKIGHEPPPAPEIIVRQQALVQEPRSSSAPAVDYDDYLVALRGRLISVEAKPGEPLRLNLESDGVLTPAEFAGAVDARFAESLRVGSELLVSGVCALT
ncbi:MAG: hypothetical protein RLZZ15_3746, partial [Verrucomicrobiota bacterium]